MFRCRVDDGRCCEQRADRGDGCSGGDLAVEWCVPRTEAEEPVRAEVGDIDVLVLACVIQWQPLPLSRSDVLSVGHAECDGKTVRPSVVVRSDSFVGVRGVEVGDLEDVRGVIRSVFGVIIFVIVLRRVQLSVHRKLRPLQSEVLCGTEHGDAVFGGNETFVEGDFYTECLVFHISFIQEGEPGGNYLQFSHRSVVLRVSVESAVLTNAAKFPQLVFCLSVANGVVFSGSEYFYEPHPFVQFFGYFFPEPLL